MGKSGSSHLSWETKNDSRHGSGRPSARRLLLGTSLSLAMFLVPIRAYLLGFTAQAFLSPFKELPKALMGACYDLLFVAGMTLLFISAGEVGRRPRWQWGVCALHKVAAVAVLASALANVMIVRQIGAPFNYPWLHYSDFLMSFEAREAIRSVGSPIALAFSGLLAAAMLWCGVVISDGLRILMDRAVK